MKKNYQVKLTLLVSMFLIILAFVSCSKNDADSKSIIDENYLNLDYSDFGKGANVKGEQELSVNEMSDEKFKIVLEGVDRFEKNVKQENGVYDLNSVDKQMLNISPALYDYCLYYFSILNSRSLQDMVVPNYEITSNTKILDELSIDLDFCYVLFFDRYGGNASSIGSYILDFLIKRLRLNLPAYFALAVAREIVNEIRNRGEQPGSRRINVCLRYIRTSDEAQLLRVEVLIVDSKPHQDTPCACGSVQQ